MITVRRARPDELQRAGELVFAAYDVEGYVASDPDPGFGAGLLNAAARAEHGEVLVAVAGSGELLGTVTIARAGSKLAEVSRDGELEFRMLATDPAARGRGIGAALVTAVVQRARDLGLHRVVLCSLPQMATAHRLYERLGFVRLPERDWEPGPGYPLLAFALDV